MKTPIREFLGRYVTIKTFNGEVERGYLTQRDDENTKVMIHKEGYSIFLPVEFIVTCHTCPKLIKDEDDLQEMYYFADLYQLRFKTHGIGLENETRFEELPMVS